MVNKTIYRTRNTRKLYIPYYLMAIAVLVYVYYINDKSGSFDGIAFKIAIGFVAGVILVTEIHRMNNLYEINLDSLIHKQGLLTTVSKRIEFGAISDIDVEQTLWQRLFGYGDIMVSKFAEKSLLVNINNPFEFSRYLEASMSKKLKPTMSNR